MTITTRGARPDDLARIHEILRQAFGKDDESNMFAYLLAHESLLEDGDVRLALDGDRPMAVTVLQRRQFRTRYGWVPGAIVTLVGCDPAVQRSGYGTAVVRDAIARMTELGLAAGILYGEADYYPRFGFAPVLPHERTEVKAAVLQGLGAAAFRPVAEADLPALASLYAEAYDRYPCNIQRGSDAPLWGVRVPEINAVLTLPDTQGYAVIRQAKDALWVVEAAAADAETGRRLLAAVGHEAAARGLEQVMLSFPPDHLVARLLRFVAPSREIRAAAIHGMAIVTDWAQVLPAGYAVSDEGLLLDGRLAVWASRRVLTQLVLGYRCADDLPLMEGVQVTADPADRARLAADFPPSFPKWSLDPFWEGD